MTLRRLHSDGGRPWPQQLKAAGVFYPWWQECFTLCTPHSYHPGWSPNPFSRLHTTCQAVLWKQLPPPGLLGLTLHGSLPFCTLFSPASDWCGCDLSGQFLSCQMRRDFPCTNETTLLALPTGSSHLLPASGSVWKATVWSTLRKITF